MGDVTLIRVVAGVLALVIFLVIVARRRRQALDE